MELSNRQSQMFIDWYIERYAEKDDNGKPITPVDIPRVPVENQREDMIEWVKIIYKILGKSKAKQTYKYRVKADGTTYRETVLEKALHSLFLQYGPTYVEKDGGIAIKPLRWDDVIDIKHFINTGEIINDYTNS